MYHIYGTSIADRNQVLTTFQIDPAVSLNVKEVMNVPGGRTPVDPRSLTNSLKILVGGQSGSASCVNAVFTPANPNDIFALRIYDGAIYPAVDPMLGDTTNPVLDIGPTPYVQGSVFLQIADKLVTNGFGPNDVMLFPIGVGGAALGEWIPRGVMSANPVRQYGYLYPRLLAAKSRFDAYGFEPDLILWVNGVTDAVDHTTQDDYVAGLQRLISEFRNTCGWDCPIFFSYETLLIGTVSTPYAPVRNAVASVTDNVTIFDGPDADTLDNTKRYDGCHWTATGAAECQALWQPLIEAVL